MSLGRSKALIPTLLVVGSVALALLGAEVAARLFHAAPWYDRLISEIVKTPSPRQNRFRIRDREFSPVKPEDTRRIMILGDSFTFGAGILDDAAVCPGRLEDVENGMAVHNLLPAFMGEDGPSLWISAYDQHPNEVGHAIAAESLKPFVLRLLREHESKAGRR